MSIKSQQGRRILTEWLIIGPETNPMSLVNLLFLFGRHSSKKPKALSTLSQKTATVTAATVTVAVFDDKLSPKSATIVASVDRL